LRFGAPGRARVEERAATNSSTWAWQSGSEEAADAAGARDMGGACPKTWGGGRWTVRLTRCSNALGMNAECDMGAACVGAACKRGRQATGRRWTLHLARPQKCVKSPNRGRATAGGAGDEHVVSREAGTRHCGNGDDRRCRNGVRLYTRAVAAPRDACGVARRGQVLGRGTLTGIRSSGGGKACQKRTERSRV